MQHLHKRILLILLILLLATSVAYAQSPTTESVTQEGREIGGVAVAIFLGIGVAIGAGGSAVIRTKLRKNRDE